MTDFLANELSNKQQKHSSTGDALWVAAVQALAPARARHCSCIRLSVRSPRGGFARHISGTRQTESGSSNWPCDPALTYLPAYLPTHNQRHFTARAGAPPQALGCPVRTLKVGGNAGALGRASHCRPSDAHAATRACRTKPYQQPVDQCHVLHSSRPD